MGLWRAIGCFHDVLQEHAPRTVARAVAAGRSVRDLLSETMTGVRKAHPLLVHDLTEIRRIAARQLLEESGDDNAHRVVDSAMTAFLHERCNVDGELYVDVLPVLQALRRRGLKLGSITNGNVDLKARSPRLRAALDFEINASQAGAGKPDAAPFLAAAHLAGVSDLRSMAHVGDSLQNDVRGARAMDICSVLLSRPDLPREEDDLTKKQGDNPDIQIETLCDLEQKLDAEWLRANRTSSL